jgi:hypothetical protein
MALSFAPINIFRFLITVILNPTARISAICRKTFMGILIKIINQKGHFCSFSYVSYQEMPIKKVPAREQIPCQKSG